jgi:hypothetical protein
MRLTRLFTALLLAALAAACQPAAEPPPLPTLVTLDDATAPPTPTPESAPASPTADANAVEVTAETAVPETATPQASATLIPSATFTPTTLPTETLPPVVTAPPSPTLPAVRIVTLTPAPGQAPTTPQALADLVITERQFQEEVDRRIASIDSIQDARIDFTPQGISAELTALGGTAFITGNVQVNIQVQGGFAVITIGDISVNAPEPPEAYVLIASREFFSLLIDVLDTTLNSRLGSQFKLEDLTLTDDSILVRLLVPA